VQSVQRNCHIADARPRARNDAVQLFAGMREFYRWEHEVPLARPLPRQELGSWISQARGAVGRAAGDDLEPLRVGEHSYDAFDVDAINAALVPQGLVYGGGYGRFGKPHFFLRNWSGAKSGRGWRCSSRVRVCARSHRSAAALQGGACSCAGTRCAAALDKIEIWACARPTAR